MLNNKKADVFSTSAFFMTIDLNFDDVIGAHNDPPRLRISGKNPANTHNIRRITPFIINSAHGNGSEPSGLLNPPAISSSAVIK